MKPGMIRVWIFTLSMIAATLVIGIIASLGLPMTPPGPFLPWWLIAILFFFTEGFVLHFQFRREAHSLSLSELPFVLGLFALPPGEFMLAIVAGSAIALGVRRHQPPVKLAFNVAHMALGAMVGQMLFHAIAPETGTIGPIQWIATFAATAGNGVIGSLAVAVAISLSEGRPAFEKLSSVLRLSLTITCTNTAIALLAVTLIAEAPEALWLLVVPSVTVAAAYRAYISERQKHETLEFLYESSQILQKSPELEAAIAELLDHARRMFRAEIAQIVLIDGRVEGAALRSTVGPGDAVKVLVASAIDPITRRVLAEGHSLLLSQSDLDVGHPDSVEPGPTMHDAMVVLIRAEQRAMGAMIVANREGDVTEFTTDDLRLLETLASQAGVALENGKLERTLDELTKLRDELRHQAFHDALTGLANRAQFLEQVQVALRDRELNVGMPVVLFLDLDDFKLVNDSMGHAAGDTLLRIIADRLRACIRPGDVAARLGGDEFAVLLLDHMDLRGANAFARRAVTSLKMPSIIEGRELSVGVSIGIAAADDAVSAEALLRNADVAMYTAKSMGKGRSATFEPTMHTAVLERHALGSDLRGALSRGELTLHYQPIFDLRERQVRGFEALIRWRHPERGMVDPAQFIGVAEDTGIIGEIGAWTLREACDQLAAWRAAVPGIRDCFVAVNLSGRNLLDPDLPELVSSALAASGLPSRLLTLELTESILLRDADSAAERLAELRALGVRIAIDDFGTGYSSLGYLRHLPVDTLKIARDFVEIIGPDASSHALAGAIIGMARGLGLTVVAEGIERPEQADRLTALGCELGQGYLFARPVAPATIRTWLDRSPALADEELPALAPPMALQVSAAAG